MPRVVFTSHLQRHVDCPEVEVPGTTLRETLDAVFADNQPLRGYVLDDLNRLRQHMMIFIDGSIIGDRDGLSDPVSESSEIYVMQALSGG
ncbi:MAG: MoaD/ThiS family protein [Planctomycetes bacterium]|nr:MoaD/ThiS family protein [Planctomycetota bacterium]